jgi:transcriptional antiterminator/mannitol/fructose-specific phosphotransferase system IIA component (Ntr-type)
MVELNQRAAKLLQSILYTPKMTIKELEKNLRCSRRQVNYDLQKINDWLQSRDLISIEYIRDKGFIINQSIRKDLEDILSTIDLPDYLPSQKDRADIIFIQLFIKKGYLSVNHFLDSIRMSRNTVLSDIQLLKGELEKEDISLTYNRQTGYELVGCEVQIRSFAFKCISGLLQSPNGFHLLEEIYDLLESKDAFAELYRDTFKVMTDIEKDLSVSFIDEQLKDLTVFFLFLLVRISNNHNTELSLGEIKDSLKHSEAYNASLRLMKNFPITINDDEIAYMSMHLLGLNTSYDEQVFPLDNPSELYRIIDQIILDFEKFACVSFSDKEEAKRSLFLHLKPAYYRMFFRIPITNPYLEKIKQEYFDLFTLVKKSLNRLEQLLKNSISEDEIGFITLHFGAFLRKHGIPYRRRQCVIICPNGVSTSSMLKSQMEQLIPEVEVVKVMSLREFKSNIHPDIDFILSTVPIKTTKPIIIVSPILTANDKAKIIQEVDLLLYQRQSQQVKTNDLIQVIKQFATINNETALYEAINNLLLGTTVTDNGRYKPMLKELLTKEMVQTTDRVTNWKEAIRLAALPLLENKTIENKYIDAMIESIEKNGPYIVLAPKVAIPHARPESGVNRVGMSLLKIDHAVSFSEGDEDKDANLIFVIAAIDNELHLKALSQLTELLEEEETINQLINCKNADELMPFIDKVSHN